MSPLPVLWTVILDGEHLRMEVQLTAQRFCLADGDAEIGGVTSKDGEYLPI